MICKSCGYELEENFKFCDRCGVRLISGQSRDSFNLPSSDFAMDEDVKDGFLTEESEKKYNLKVYIIIAVIGVIGVALISIIDGIGVNKHQDAIQNTKVAHFEFFPEITVGELISEYYGDKYWIVEDGIVNFYGDNKVDGSGISILFDEVTNDTVDILQARYCNPCEESFEITTEEFKDYILSLYDEYAYGDEYAEQINIETTDDEMNSGDSKMQEYYNLAVQYQESGQYDTALEWFEIIADDGYDVSEEIEYCKLLKIEYIYSQAEDFYQTNSYEEAQELFEIIIDYKDSNEKIELCKKKLNQTLDITSNDAIYYFGKTLEMIRSVYGEPDCDPLFHPSAAPVGGHHTNSYQYGKIDFSYVDVYPDLDARVISISAFESGELCSNLKVGMTFKELSEYVEFESEVPLEMEIEQGCAASSYIKINEHNCILNVEFPLGADINTPSNGMYIYTKDGLADDENDRQKSNKPLYGGKAEMYGIVTLSDENSYLNIRNGPSTNDTIIGKLYNNTEIVLTGSTLGWYYTEGEHGTGWVSADYVTIVNQSH